jgi:Fe-S oxidoreductase
MDKELKKLVPPGLSYIADNIVSRQNILGSSKEQKAKWAKGLGLPGNGETVFFAGCGYQYSSDVVALSSLLKKMDKSAFGAELPMRFAGLQKKLGADVAGVYRRFASKGSESDVQPLRDAVKVLGRLNIQFGYLGEEEPCCGAPLYHTGYRYEFAENARKTYAKLKSQGVKKIIGIVPSCTHALRELFPLYVDGYDLEVRHFLEVVLENISDMKLRFPGEAKVTYHDSCQLARYLGLIEEPRQILRAVQGIELVETDWTKGEWATCCGGGGGFEAVFPELSQILAAKRAGELVETGASIIATHCPGCIMQLRDGLNQKKAQNVEVMDLAQILAMAVEG